MRLKGCDLFGGVIIVDTELEIIGAANNPILPGNKTTSSNGNVGEFESFDNGLILMSLTSSSHGWLEEAYL